MNATDRQISFIRSLLDERAIPASETATSEERKATALRLLDNGAFSKVQASATISWLLELPKVHAGTATVTSPSNFPEVPAGRYAVEGEDGTLKFYKLDRPTEGRWSGYTFLAVQASDDLHPIKGRAAKQSIIAKIAANPAEAARTYGRELGACGVCGRTLTNDVSRSLGIGPVCGARTGWTTADEQAALDAAGE